MKALNAKSVYKGMNNVKYQINKSLIPLPRFDPDRVHNHKQIKKINLKRIS